MNQLKEATEVFWGYFDSENHVGFIAVQDEEKGLRMSRLLVHPKCFSRGIGTKLVQYALEGLRNGRQVIASTGAQNLPTKRLYEKFGFSQRHHFTTQGISKAIYVLFSSLFILAACSTAPKMQSEHIRPWSRALGSEYPKERPVIAHYKKGQYELFYLAARHTNAIGEDTLNLVQTLFDKFNFNILMIESIPYSSGESPKWFVEEARQGRTEKFIRGGESALSVILADEKKIPFIAAEPDPQDIYRGLKTKGYTDEDILGFYTVRQVPQWVRENIDKKTLLKKKIPPFLTHYCKVFSVRSCPTLEDVMRWYKSKLGHDLVPDVSNEEVAPYSEGSLYTQKISSDIGFIRDHFTLNLIEEMLRKYKRVAVIYGAGHFLTLRKSFDNALGEPFFIEDKN